MASGFTSASSRTPHTSSFRRVSWRAIEALTHTDAWTADDEQALLDSPEVATLLERAASEGEHWHRKTQERGKRFRWGQKHPPWHPDHIPPPATTEQRLDTLRSELSTVHSEMVPFGEPLIYSLDDQHAGSALELPDGVAPVGSGDRVCMLVHGFDLKPQEGEIITGVEPKFTYVKPKGLTYGMVPNQELEERFRANASVKLGIGAGVQAGIPSLPVAPLINVAAAGEASAKAGIGWTWDYRVLKAKVLDVGTQSDFAEWKIRRRELLGKLELRTIMRLPKSARKLTLEISGSYSVRKARFSGFRPERRAVLDPVTVAGKIVPPPATTL